MQHQQLQFELLLGIKEFIYTYIVAKITKIVSLSINHHQLCLSANWPNFSCITATYWAPYLSLFDSMFSHTVMELSLLSIKLSTSSSLFFFHIVLTVMCRWMALCVYIHTYSPFYKHSRHYPYLFISCDLTFCRCILSTRGSKTKNTSALRFVTNTSSDAASFQKVVVPITPSTIGKQADHPQY